MKLFLQRNKFFLILILLFVIAEIIVGPLGEFPLVDDWSYAQALQYYKRTGIINFGNFPAMTLLTQILWGFLFIKTFGFSFLILRFSTFVSLIIGLAFLNRLITQISGNRMIAFLACLLLLFVPMVFNLANTFMTDVNFNTLTIICCYLMYNYFRSYQWVYYAGFIAAAALLVLLRQYGIVFPACFVAASFFVKEKKVQRIILSVIAMAVVTYVLKRYENYLAHELPANSTYKFSGNVNLLARSFWDNFFVSFALKRKEITIQSLMYIMPFAIIFLRHLLKQVSTKLIVALLLLNLGFVYLLFSSKGLTSGTIFSNMMLGVESFAESFKGARHNVYSSFEVFMDTVKCISVFLTLFVFSLGAANIIVQQQWKRLLRPEIICFVLLIFAYVFMLLITESYFDRYHIPLITLFLILTAYLAGTSLFNWRLAVVPLLFWVFVSISGTKDYMSWNQQRWQAYWFLRRDLKIPKGQIDGGFEVNCWNEGEAVGWNNFTDTAPFNYLIQFNAEPGFVPWKEYSFQRYFPYRKDKIYIFVRQKKPGNL